MENRNSLLTISEMAQYSGVPAKTLRYYDEIGLIKPFVRDKDSSYRYYDRTQLEQIVLLQSLKSLGMSLADIKKEFDNMSSRRYAQLLALRAAKIDDQMKELERQKKNLSEWLREVDEAIGSQPGRCYIRHYPQIQGYLYPIEIRSREEMELSLRKIEKLYGGGTHVGRVIRVVAQDSFSEREYLTYSGLFIPKTSVSVSCEMPECVIPEGDYGVIFASVPHEQCPAYWDELVTFVRKNGYSITGSAYRAIPVEMGISRLENDYVSKMFFQVQK